MRASWDTQAYEAIERPRGSELEDLLGLYHGEWWCRRRSAEETRAVVEGSDLCLGFREVSTGRLVAFARVVTDGVFKATVFDVIVASEHRGRGLGAALVERVLTHPRVAEVRHVELHCLPELEPYYEALGFERPSELVLLRCERST